MTQYYPMYWYGSKHLQNVRFFSMECETSDPIGLCCLPFALFSSTFWVYKHQQRVGMRNRNNLKKSHRLGSIRLCKSSAKYTDIELYVLYTYNSSGGSKFSLFSEIWYWETCRMWPSRVTFNRLVSSSCQKQKLSDQLTERWPKNLHS